MVFVTGRIWISQNSSPCRNRRTWANQKTPWITYIIELGDKMEKELAPHSSVLVWKIPWTEEPGRLQSMGSLSRARMSNFTFTFHFHALEKEMATHSSVLAWRILGTGEPGGLPSMGSHRVGHDWSDLAGDKMSSLIPRFEHMETNQWQVQDMHCVRICLGRALGQG